MSDTTPEPVEHTTGSSAPTGIARCNALDGQTEPFTVNGVAIGADEVTLGSNGPKYWPSDELRRAVQSLVGVPLTKNHDDDRVESVVGEVVEAGFEPDVGIVFEAEVDDEDLATKIARGRLDVSIHAAHRANGVTDNGEMIVADIRFLDLSVVPRGGSPSNFVEAGSSPSEALASLNADDVEGYLETGTSTNTTMEEQVEDVEPDDNAAALDEDVEADATSDEAEVSEAPDTESESESTEAEVAAESDTPSESEDDGLATELEELRAENQELRNELESVRLEYAERLSDETPFDAAELTSKFSFDELQAKFEHAEASLVPETETVDNEAVPNPQTGDTSATESVQSADEQSEIAELEGKIENYAELGWDAAKSDAEDRLDELRA